MENVTTHRSAAAAAAVAVAAGVLSMTSTKRSVCRSKIHTFIQQVKRRRTIPSSLLCFIYLFIHVSTNHQRNIMHASKTPHAKYVRRVNNTTQLSNRKVPPRQSGQCVEKLRATIFMHMFSVEKQRIYISYTVLFCTL